MSNEDLPPQLALERVKLLWDKWKYHDSLAYGRLQQFLQMQAIVIAGAIVAWANSFPEISAVMLFLGAALSWFQHSMFKKDMRVRNAFNPEVVEALREAQILNIHITESDKKRWSPLCRHSVINLWHVHPQLLDDNAGRASADAEKLMVLVGGLEAIVLVLIAGTIIFDLVK